MLLRMKKYSSYIMERWGEVLMRMIQKVCWDNSQLFSHLSSSGSQVSSPSGFISSSKYTVLTSFWCSYKLIPLLYTCLSSFLPSLDITVSVLNAEAWSLPILFSDLEYWAVSLSQNKLSKINILCDIREMGWGGMDRIDLAHDRDYWRAFVNTLMKHNVYNPTR
jgi:hypothetical protein